MTLNIPPFLGQDKQLTATEMEEHGVLQSYEFMWRELLVRPITT